MCIDPVEALAQGASRSKVSRRPLAGGVEPDGFVTEDLLSVTAMRCRWP